MDQNFFNNVLDEGARNQDDTFVYYEGEEVQEGETKKRQRGRYTLKRRKKKEDKGNLDVSQSEGEEEKNEAEEGEEEEAGTGEINTEVYIRKMSKSFLVESKEEETEEEEHNDQNLFVLDLDHEVLDYVKKRDLKGLINGNGGQNEKIYLQNSSYILISVIIYVRQNKKQLQ